MMGLAGLPRGRPSPDHCPARTGPGGLNTKAVPAETVPTTTATSTAGATPPSLDTHYRPATYVATHPERPAVDHVVRPDGDFRRPRRAVVPAGARPLRPGPSSRRPCRHPFAQRRADLRSRVRCPAFGALLHDGQHAPDGRRGRVHRERLRGPHPGDLGATEQPGGRDGPAHACDRAAPDAQLTMRTCRTGTWPTTISSVPTPASRSPTRWRASRCSTPRAPRAIRRVCGAP